MSESTAGAPQLNTVQIRVYYDPNSGAIVHVHSLAVATGDELDSDRIEQEMTLFETSLRQRHGRELDYLVTDEAALSEATSPDVNLRVDPRTRQLVRETYTS